MPEQKEEFFPTFWTSDSQSSSVMERTFDMWTPRFLERAGWREGSSGGEGREKGRGERGGGERKGGSEGRGGREGVGVGEGGKEWG